MENPRILIVEDEIIVTTVIEKILQKIGCSVCGTATSGEVAIKLALEHKPDLVLMDITLAGKMNGIEAGQGIVAELGIPIIFMTGYGDDDTIALAKTVSPGAYLIKPVQQTALKASIVCGLSACFHRNGICDPCQPGTRATTRS